MPRKNKFHSSIVISLLREKKWCKDFEFVPIHKLQHQKVLEVLRDTLLFLSFGHPEGFGLPVAEALVNCCAVVGYSGLGGRELMNVAENAKTAFEVELEIHGFIDHTYLILSMMNHDFPDFANRALQVSHRIGSEYQRVFSSFHRALTNFRFVYIVYFQPLL